MFSAQPRSWLWKLVLARERSGRKGNRSCQPINSINGGSELALQSCFLKRQKVQLTGLAVTPQAPVLMRNHFISSAPRGHLFSAANQTISSKFQRLETIISVISEPFLVPSRQGPAVPAQRLPAPRCFRLPLFTCACVP